MIAMNHPQLSINIAVCDTAQMGVKKIEADRLTRQNPMKYEGFMSWLFVAIIVVVGLPDAAVKESKDGVPTALARKL